MDKLLPKNDYLRRIIHLDMDAFYASVEMRDHPEYRQKALVIGRDPRKSHGHGVIATANYLARQYGVHSAMPTSCALKQVPADKLQFCEPDFQKYRAVSEQIHAIMRQVTDEIEPISLDEAYLDVTQNKLGNYSAIELAVFLQKQIYRELNLTCSVGISYNKFLAKMGSEYAKPFGRTVILPEFATEFLKKMPASAFPGVGKKMQEKLNSLGISTGADLQAKSVDYLLENFKKAGYYLAQHAHGIDLSPVKSHRERKSLGKERTFDQAVYSLERANRLLDEFSKQLEQKLTDRKLIYQVVTIKLRSQNFETITRSASLKKGQTGFEVAKRLLRQNAEFVEKGIRLLGLSYSGLESIKYEPIDLFETSDFAKL